MSSDQFPYKLLPPPENLPEYDAAHTADISYIGKVLYISGMYQSKEIFGIKRVDRNRHTYILGKSGMGKTCLIENLVRTDIEHGFGVAVIDPHGDLAQNILKCIPPNRISDVVYIDPSDLESPLAFNPFACVPREHHQQVSQGLVEIFKKQFASTWTPRIEHLFRFATLAMLEYNEGTLYGLLQLITDSQYRQQVLQNIQDDIVKRFFSVEFAGYTQKYDTEAITPLVNRLGHFFSDPLMRGIFMNPQNKIDVEHIMNTGKILIVNTSKGILGEENSALFGSFFLTKIEQAAMARSREQKENRSPFYLYVDEFQNVATESFISLFSESRKYAINITVANQYLSQIPESLMNAILGNVGTMIIFRLGGQDAERISKEFQPELRSHDFLNLGLGEFYIKMSVEGKTLPPFSATSTLIKVSPYSGNVSLILQNTKEKHKQTEPLPVISEKDFVQPNSELPPPT